MVTRDGVGKAFVGLWLDEVTAPTRSEDRTCELAHLVSNGLWCVVCLCHGCGGSSLVNETIAALHAFLLQRVRTLISKL